MTFGLLIDWISSHYHQQVWLGAQTYCRDHGINLMTLVAGRAGSPYRWEQMRNQMMEFVGSRKFDGYLFLTSTLANHLNEDQLKALVDKAAPAPVVSLGAPLPGAPMVMVDNRQGFLSILDHLVKEHRYTRFAFAGGPTQNIDARERLELFRDFAGRRGLVLNEDWIQAGDFSSAWGHRFIEEVVQTGRPPFEVLVCANDEIAMGAIDGLAARGLRVPGDLAVTGFDDVLTSGPAALTTVRQLLSELGRAGAERLDGLLRQVPGPDVVKTPTEIVVRQSCGCLSPAAREAHVDPRAEFAIRFEDLVKNHRGAILEGLCSDGLPRVLGEQLLRDFCEAWETREYHQFHHRFQDLVHSPEAARLSPGEFQLPLSVLRAWVLKAQEPADRRAFTETLVHRGRIYLTETLHIWSVQRETHQFLLKDLLSDLNERLLYSRDFEDQASIVLDIFPQLDIHRFAMALYEDPAHPMDRARLVLTERGAVAGGGALFEPLELFPEGYAPQEEPWGLVAEALFDRHSPLGFLLLDAHGDSDLLTVFDQLCERVGRGLETVKRIHSLEEEVAARTEQLREALEDLEAYNVQLKELALRDELTGLYNRRGFLTLAEHQMKTVYRQGPPATLFYADLDGLKRVNDTWGHEAGDEAIQTAARLLADTFRSQDLVARLGGDEFVVLAPGCSGTDAEGLAARLRQRVIEASQGRWGLSLGWIVLEPRTRRPLADWMKEADEALYKEKQAKRARARPETA